MSALSDPPLLQAKALSFSRQDEPVFGPLDFCLRHGEIALIEGDNGSGKTTLLRLLAGLLHADECALHWCGQPLDRAACRSQIAFIGHQLGLKSELSPRENLHATAGLYGRRPGVDETMVLRQVGLHGFEDEPVRRLSAGQKKRAALARLVLLPATLWLLDEPYANLDRHGIALVNQLLDRHAAAGGAALVSSHGVVSHRDDASQRVRMHA